VARYHPQKDHKTFLRAAANLASVHRHIRFILVGRDVTKTNSTLWDLIRQLNLQKMAILLGERKDVQRLMASLDIFSLTSKTEGFPNTLGEAMSCGVPCVATNVGDVKRIAGPYGRIVPDSDPAAVANAWLQLISAGSAQRKTLGLAARDHVTRNFSIESIAAQYTALYEESFQQNGRKDLH
jgi:glycosyltransferase involved in cell wall biosynthesis